MKEKAPTCVRCPQNETCDMNGYPISITEKATIVAEERNCWVYCFFYCCKFGRRAARIVLENARQQKKTGIFPFGTEDKPFIPGIGRFVVSGSHLDFNNGDVVVLDETGNYVFIRSILKET